MHKVLGIAISGFLAVDNDIKEGRVVKVKMDRVVRMVATNEDSYKRVYKDDGSYTYPILLENRLRAKCELYF